MLLTHASFELDGSSGVSGAERAAPLARALCVALEQHGLAVQPLGGLDYAADFRVRVGERTFYGMLGPVDDGVRQWLLSFDSLLPVWRRWFGANDKTELQALLVAAHQVLARIPDIRSVRWYTAQDWNEAPDERWHPDPAV